MLTALDLFDVHFFSLTAPLLPTPPRGRVWGRLYSRFIFFSIFPELISDSYLKLVVNAAWDIVASSSVLSPYKPDVMWANAPGKQHCCEASSSVLVVEMMWIFLSRFFLHIIFSFLLSFLFLFIYLSLPW